MTALIIDSEADGLLGTVTQIWCVCTKDVDTGETKRWKYDRLKEFKEYAEGYDQWVGHNIIGYDCPLFLRFLNMRRPLTPAHILDTLTLSLLSKYTRQNGHGLDGWGKTLNFPKGGFTDFSHYSDEMMDYCENDVELTYKVLRYLQIETAGYDLTQAIQIEYLTTKYMDKQQKNGFALDVRKTHSLYCELKENRDDKEETLQDSFQPKGIELCIKPKRKEDGSVSKVGLGCLGDQFQYAAGEFCPVKYKTFNPGSPKQVLERLDGYWNPTEYTKPSKTHPDGQARITEKNLGTLHSDAPKGAHVLAEYLMLKSRTKLVETWLEEEKDGRIHGKVWGIGAITHRMSHSEPNMANVPGSTSPYGVQCRSCWTVDNPETQVLLGTDAKGIQLRVLAHYMADLDYIEEVVNGDIHTRNKEALGIDSRDVAKTFIYAWLLGAGSAKIGAIIGGSAREGREATERFLEAYPALVRLKLKAATAAGLGYMVGLDGRHVEIKSEHYALSAYLQSAESILMKVALHLWNKRSTHLHYKHVATIHDEWQTEALKTEAQELGHIQCKAIRDAGKMLCCKCPMDGNFTIGNNWQETH